MHRYVIILLTFGLLYSVDCQDGYVDNTANSVTGEECIPDFFAYLTSNFKAFYFFEDASINGDPIESDDWIGAFYGDICVGATLWDTSQCNNGVCDVVVMGDDQFEDTNGYMAPGLVPTFIIYDASEHKYYNFLDSMKLLYLK